MSEVTDYINMFAEAIAQLFAYIKKFLDEMGISLGGTSEEDDTDAE